MRKNNEAERKQGPYIGQLRLWPMGSRAWSRVAIRSSANISINGARCKGSITCRVGGARSDDLVSITREVKWAHLTCLEASFLLLNFLSQAGQDSGVNGSARNRVMDCPAMERVSEGRKMNEIMMTNHSPL